MMDVWYLPKYAEICGKSIEINADFRDILEIIGILNDETIIEPLRIYIAGCAFSDEYENLTDSEKSELIAFMMQFINCGSETEKIENRPKRIDWEQDKQLIIDDVNKVAGKEIRSDPFVHWWTFLSWFNGIGEGRLSTVVGIRDKLRTGKKLEKWESEYYAENRNEIDFRNKYTDAETELIKKWTGGGSANGKA